MRQRPSLHAVLLATALAIGPLAPHSFAVKPPRAPSASQPKKNEKQTQGARQTPIDDFMRMSPDERRKALDRLPPDRRQKVEEQLRRFNALPEDEQLRLKTLVGRLHSLPPERQEAVRKAANELMKSPPERRQAMQDQLRQMAGMTQPEREAYLQSPDFRHTFNKGEQGIVRNMSDLLPANPAETPSAKPDDLQFF
jgi:hypothetical protein